MVVDADSFHWRDNDWPGLTLRNAVLYELHIGTFTEEGTFDAAIHQFEELKSLGITALEVMPVAECPGRWNWGYDGVNLFAPYHVYGDADAFRRFVDAAHVAGLAVILDVVYNHFGPDGNFLPEFSPYYFTDRYANEWGEAINFDGPHSAAVREFVIQNACCWVREFHVDGLRLDATQAMHDAGPVHVLAELSQRVRACAHPRPVLLFAENEPQNIAMVELVEHGGCGLDAMWNDDFHHTARVAVTGRRDGYFHDYRGHAQEFVSAVKRGFLYQGQYYQWQKQPRGTSTRGRPAHAFVVFTQNHDQVANTFYGQRLHHMISPARDRALTALLLLGPQIPLLFMGQEFAASSPFTFFADHAPALALQVWAGRREFLAQFETYATGAAQQAIADPAAERTFAACKLDFGERAKNQHVVALHRDLLQVRREDQVISSASLDAIDGAVLSERAFVLRWFDARHGDRLLVVNLGEDMIYGPAPEPLLAPPANAAWQLEWSSDEPVYDGPGALNPCRPDGWHLSAESAVLLQCQGSSLSTLPAAKETQ